MIARIIKSLRTLLSSYESKKDFFSAKTGQKEECEEEELCNPSSAEFNEEFAN